MKNLVLLTLILISFNAQAQYLSGIYSGKLVNDSTKKEQNYELALSEYRGKITGYAYTTFVVNDTFYYSIKRIKATRVNGALVVEDVKMLANNFPESPAKRVKQTNTIPLNESQDTLVSLNGKWQTNQTKEYYSLYGAVDMQKNSDSSRSTLLAHLEELQLIPSRTAASSGPAIAQSNPAKNTKPANTGVGGGTGADNNSTAATGTRSTASTTSKGTSTGNAGTTSGLASSGADSSTSNNNTANNTKANPATGTAGPDVAKSVGTKSGGTNSNEVTASRRNTRSGKKNAQPEPVVAAAYIPYTERGVNVLQEMDIASDSLVLSFYDNGVVDGDMISVYVNNENVLAPTKLTEAATKKTVYLNSFASDSVQLILVAENLGTLPPNTGLLVIQDGAKRYEVRFSADLQTNAALVFRKRK
jgi:hypothetical protein